MKAFLLIALGLLTGVSQTARADDTIERGRYLSVAADCVACHTSPKQGKPYAGGYAIASPLGEIWASNITPSTSHGIGNYTEADFAKAVREGVRKDGAHLYPAMPYTSYAKLTDEDIHALYVYFMQAVAPVDEEARTTELPFPFSVRSSMAVWNLLFLDKTPSTLIRRRVPSGIGGLPGGRVGALLQLPQSTRPDDAGSGRQSLCRWFAGRLVCAQHHLAPDQRDRRVDR
ncbi:cytochrome c [Stenotrophomonas rhizophila]